MGLHFRNANNRMNSATNVYMRCLFLGLQRGGRYLPAQLQFWSHKMNNFYAIEIREQKYNKMAINQSTQQSTLFTSRSLSFLKIGVHVARSIWKVSNLQLWSYGDKSPVKNLTR